MSAHSRKFLPFVLVIALALMLPGAASAATFSPDMAPNMELKTFDYDGDTYTMRPTGAAFDAAGNMYISDENNSCIVKFSPTGAQLAIWGSSFTPGTASLGDPHGLAFDAAGYLYVADYYGEVVKIDQNGVEVPFWADSPGVRPDTCCGNDIAVLPDGSKVYVASDDSEMLVFDPTDRFLESIFASTGSEMYGVALDSAGNVYGSFYDSETVAKWLPSGEIDTTWADAGYADSGWSDGNYPYYCEPMGLRFDDAGNLLVVDYCDDIVDVMNSNGEYVTHFPQDPDAIGGIDPYLYDPSAIALQGGKMIVCDTGNDRAVVYGVVSDKVAPVTSIHAPGTWMQVGSFTLSATDIGSGVARTYYTLNDGPETEYDGAVKVPGAGVNAVTYWSVDKAGNIERAKSASIKVDFTAPVTTASTTLTFDGVATIDLAAVDSQSGVAETSYRVLDASGGPRKFGNRVVYTTPGTYTLVFSSIDNAGNAEASQKLVFTLRNNVYFSLSGPEVVAAGAAAPLNLQFEANGITGPHTAKIQSSANGVTWSDAGDAAAPSLGTFVARPLVSTYYRAVFAGDADHAPATSPALLVQVPSAAVGGAITIGSSASSVVMPKPFVLSGVLTSGENGDPCVVYVRKPGSSRWSYSSARLAYGAAGGSAKWWYRYTPKARGTYSFYVKFAGDSGAPAATSRTISVSVR